MMKPMFHSWKRKIQTYLVIIVLITMVFALVAMVLLGGYRFHWDWTGFSNKTFWDWLNLLGVLAIPVAVALGTAWFTTKQGQASQAENMDNQRETALQAYIDKISELLIEKQLRNSSMDNEVRSIARVRTITTLSRLDSARKRNIVQFLCESRLIYRDAPIVELSGSDLNGADLSGIDLSGTDLSGVQLVGANLSGAILQGANLRGANLKMADLRRAKLLSANLSKANLLRVRVEQDRLGIVVSLEGATMPDGSVHF